MAADEVKARGNPCGKLSTRYVVAILGSIGMGIIYGLKVNLHVNIVSMVNHTAILSHNNNTENITNVGSCESATTNSSDAPEDGPFVWDGDVQGLLLSSYFWGYIVAQVPGGRIAELFSAKWVMFFAVAINVVCTILSPLVSWWSPWALIVIRVLEGIGGGVTFPSMHVILAHWAPPNERSIMSSIVYAGTALGTVIFMLISGLIAAALNWEWVFYIEGALSAIWLIFWATFVGDNPKKLAFISSEEREFITKSLHQDSQNVKHEEHHKIPWKSVFTSPPFLAILVAHTCSNWGWYMVLIELPQYMKSVLNFKISANAVLTSMPFLCMFLFSLIFGKALDVSRSKNMISTTTARKIATGVASIIPMICFVILCYIGCERMLAVALMTIAITSIGGMFSGFLSNHIDIAPNFAGTLMAITNTVASIPGIVVPIFVGKLTKHDHSIHAWRIIFWTTVVLYVIEILAYLLFGSGEEQAWNQIEDTPGEAQPLKSPKEEKKIEDKI